MEAYVKVGIIRHHRLDGLKVEFIATEKRVVGSEAYEGAVFLSSGHLVGMLD